MKFWTQERLEKFAGNEFNLCTRKYPSILFIMTFSMGVLGVTLMEDLRSLVSGAHANSMWGKYWMGFVMATTSVLQQRSLWKKVESMKAANNPAHATGKPAPGR